MNTKMEELKNTATSFVNNHWKGILLSVCSLQVGMMIGLNHNKGPICNDCTLNVFADGSKSKIS